MDLSFKIRYCSESTNSYIQDWKFCYILLMVPKIMQLYILSPEVQTIHSRNQKNLLIAYF